MGEAWLGYPGRPAYPEASHGFVIVPSSNQCVDADKFTFEVAGMLPPFGNTTDQTFCGNVGCYVMP